METDADAAASLKAEDWDLDALAATFAGSPIAAYDWVRTKTRFEPYSGILRGALGTLSARAGNAADRARLLAGLLKRMDVKVRYARATLDAAMAARLVEAAFAPTSISASAPRSELLDAAALRGARDYALLRSELAAEADAAADTSLAEALAASADHVWVEAEIGGAWVALDPAAPTSGETLAVASATLDELGDEMHQTVTFRVSATAIDAGVVSQIETLKVTLPATRLNGAAIFLAFVANPKEGGIGGAINKAMSGVSTYVPVLYVDGEPFVGEVVPGLVPAEGGGGINDLLGGGDETAQAELARLELTIETAAPSGAAVSATRTLLDRAPTAAAIDGTMQLSALPMAGGAPAVVAAIHNIQVTSGPVNLRNAYALRALAVTEVVMTLSDPEKVKDLSPPDLMWPVAAINQTLPIMIENAIVPAINDVSDVKAFTGRPRVTILSSGMLDVDEGGEFRFFEIDLKLSGLTVLARDGAAKAAFERRLWAGILDSAAETEFGLRQGRLALDPDTTERVSASGVSDQPLVRHDKASPGFDTTSPRTAVTAVSSRRLARSRRGGKSTPPAARRAPFWLPIWAGNDPMAATGPSRRERWIRAGVANAPASIRGAAAWCI